MLVRRMSSFAGVVALLATVLPGSAVAADPATVGQVVAPPAPADGTAVTNWRRARQRTVDQSQHPEYLAMSTALTERCAHDGNDWCLWVDPYRVDWDGQPGEGEPRGIMTAVDFPSRNGVTLRGHLWRPAPTREDPVRARRTAERLPGVVLMNALGNSEQVYWGIAQSLAESGYLVLTFDPECHGLSGCPAPPPSDPAGDPGGTVADVAAAVDAGARHGAYLAGCLVSGCDQGYLAAWYDRLQATFVEGALDATDWLLSGDNPARDHLRGDRLALIGHSFGGHGALVAAHTDPSRRFSAVVAFDSYGRLGQDIDPSVPTMFQRSDVEETGPHRQPPDPDETHNPTRNAQRFAAAGVDTAHVALGGSTHQEWHYTPYWGPAFAGTLTASSHGERVAVHYTLAWLDRYLKAGLSRLRATARLTAATFDDSADVSSIGQGTWDPVRGNVPYTIAGDEVAGHLSPYHRSYVLVGAVACPDLRLGCD